MPAEKSRAFSGNPDFWTGLSGALRNITSKVEYIHLNPVRAGLVKRAEDWPWSSVHDYSGSLSAAVSANRILAVDRILLPADERTHI